MSSFFKTIIYLAECTFCHFFFLLLWRLFWQNNMFCTDGSESSTLHPAGHFCCPCVPVHRAGTTYWQSSRGICGGTISCLFRSLYEPLRRLNFSLNEIIVHFIITFFLIKKYALIFLPKWMLPLETQINMFHFFFFRILVSRNIIMIKFLLILSLMFSDNRSCTPHTKWNEITFE